MENILSAEAISPFAEASQDTSSAPFTEIGSIYEAERPRVFRFLLFHLRDPDAAQSLTQDTFLKAWRSRDSFRGDCAPSTWLMRIALNLARDYTRGGSYKFWQRSRKTSVNADSIAEILPQRAASAEQRLIEREQVARLWRCVDNLSEKQRTVFLLRYVEEMELGEIASTVGMPLSTVKTHLYRALERLRTTMKEER